MSEFDVRTVKFNVYFFLCTALNTALRSDSLSTELSVCMKNFNSFASRVSEISRFKFQKILYCLTTNFRYFIFSSTNYFSDKKIVGTREMPNYMPRKKIILFCQFLKTNFPQIIDRLERFARSWCYCIQAFNYRVNNVTIAGNFVVQKSDPVFEKIFQVMTPIIIQKIDWYFLIGCGP